MWGISCSIDTKYAPVILGHLKSKDENDEKSLDDETKQHFFITPKS